MFVPLFMIKISHCPPIMTKWPSISLKACGENGNNDMHFKPCKDDFHLITKQAMH